MSAVVLRRDQNGLVSATLQTLLIVPLARDNRPVAARDLECTPHAIELDVVRFTIANKAGQLSRAGRRGENHLSSVDRGIQLSSAV